MKSRSNDLDSISSRIEYVILTLTGYSHSPFEASEASGDSITITKNAMLDSLIELSRLNDWVKGLSKTHKAGLTNE